MKALYCQNSCFDWTKEKLVGFDGNHIEALITSPTHEISFYMPIQHPDKDQLIEMKRRISKRNFSLMKQTFEAALKSQAFLWNA